MAEYECHPVWLGPPEDVENVPVYSLRISQKLAASINDWAESYEATYHPDDPISSGFADEGMKRTFAEAGASLASRLQKELGEKYSVTYFNVLSSMDEPVAQ